MPRLRQVIKVRAIAIYCGNRLDFKMGFQKGKEMEKKENQCPKSIPMANVAPIDSNVFALERSCTRRSKRKRKMIPIFAAEDRLAGNKDAKPIGWMSDPDEIGPVFVDMETLKRLATGTGEGEE